MTTAPLGTPVTSDLWGDADGLSRRGLAVDVATGATFGLVVALLQTQLEAWTWLPAALLGAALAVRRLAPVAMVGLAVVASFVQVVSGNVAWLACVAYVPLFVTVGSHRDVRVRRLGLACAGVAVVVAGGWEWAQLADENSVRARSVAAVAFAAVTALVAVGSWIVGTCGGSDDRRSRHGRTQLFKSWSARGCATSTSRSRRAAGSRPTCTTWSRTHGPWWRPRRTAPATSCRPTPTGRSRRGLRALAEEAETRLGAVGRTSLVHSDLNPKNLIVDPESLTVAAVLDWEFAHSGSPYTDLGNAVRFDRQPAWVDAVVTTYATRLGEDPSVALGLARRADLWALVELASRRGANPVADRAHDLPHAVAVSGDVHASPIRQ